MVAHPYAGEHAVGRSAVVKSGLLGFVGAAWVLVALPAAAHHSFAAEFDINRPVKLTGTVTRLEWTNPHAWIFIDAKDDKGSVQSWAIELVGINDLLRRGWGRDRVKEGDVINVDGFGAKNGTNTGNAASVTLASTGELLWASVPRSEEK
jgi:DNA/RNA endonuclease YhcR with UshA esterase domain